MLDYWEAHARRFGDLDYGRDPGGLANVCGPGQPLWLGMHLARFQRHVFEELLSGVPSPAPGATALDVGTGAGRWANLLAEAGYRTTGIDLQRRLVEDNRRRFPQIEFHVVAAQDYEPEAPFDLVSSVTVLQHVPVDQQIAAIRRLHRITKPGGHAIVLEHILDQAPHLFSRSVDEWRSVFREAGFECLAIRRYNYGPALRWYSAIRKRLKKPDWRRASDADLRPEDLVARKAEPVRPGVSHAARVGDRTLMRIAVAVDGALEPRLISRQPHGARAADCGFLFRA
jgi:SAM-dependent methyltransferase